MTIEIETIDMKALIDEYRLLFSCEKEAHDKLLTDLKLNKELIVSESRGNLSSEQYLRMAILGTYAEKRNLPNLDSPKFKFIKDAIMADPNWDKRPIMLQRFVRLLSRWYDVGDTMNLLEQFISRRDFLEKALFERTCKMIVKCENHDGNRYGISVEYV
jgi:hypothetical protein